MRRFSRSESGAVAVEAGIIVPVLILLGIGAVDASMLYQQTHRMEAGLAAGGSYLAAGPANPADRTRARNVAVSGEAANGDPRLPGWTPDDVQIAIRNIDNGSGTYRAGSVVRVARLSSTTPYQGFGFIRSLTGGRVQVKGSFETRLSQ